jgi:hypothetical protein
MRPAIFALRVPKAALKKAVTAPQLVATFFSATLANLGGGRKSHFSIGLSYSIPP